MAVGVLNTVGVAPCRAEVISFAEHYLPELWDLPSKFKWKSFSFNKSKWPYLSSYGSYPSYMYITSDEYCKNVLDYLKNVQDDKANVLQRIQNDFICTQYLADIQNNITNQFTDIKIKSMFNIFVSYYT